MQKFIKILFATSAAFILIVFPLLFYFTAKILLFSNPGYIFIAALSIISLSMESMTAFHIKILGLYEMNGDNKDSATEYSETPTTHKPGFTLKTHGKDSDSFESRIKSIRDET